MPESTSGSPASLRRALMRYPTPGGRRWLDFSEPIEQFVTHELDQVIPTIERIEDASHRGYWLAGMISYDASPAFDSALVTHRNPDVPLVAFASFEKPERSRGPVRGNYRIGEWQQSIDQAGYESAVAGVRDRIAAGSTYQVNFTMRLNAEFEGDPEGFFAELCRAQRADHLAFLDFGNHMVCSVSPELFLRRAGQHLTTRPMKGTRPRHPDPTIDRTRANDLVRSEKDRAENTMIVDMCRNDLGRIATVGTVETTSLHRVETYPTVHQLTSTVEADTQANLAELLSATFPPASITGAPKVATSRIIAELETEPRGVYCGSVGVVEPGGDLELNVAIRTAWIDKTRKQVTYGAGGGIVWDSTPRGEWTEALDKAKVLVRATEPFSLLETIAWTPSAGAVLLDRHMSRLTSTAAHFGFDLDVGEVTRRIEAIGEPSTVTLRLLVSSDGAVDIEVREPPAELPATPVALALDSEPVMTDNEFLRHKTTRRHRYEEARRRFPDAFDVLLWNERGEITEGTIANLVVEIDGRLLTPHHRSGLLPGTLRAELLDANRITETVLTVDDLRQAAAAWLINSVRGWIAVEPAPANLVDVLKIQGHA